MTASNGIERVRSLLETIEREMDQTGDPAGSIDLFPWLKVVDVRRFLETMRNEIHAVTNGKGPIGYPVTTAVWEDLVTKLEALAERLSGSSNSP